MKIFLFVLAGFIGGVLGGMGMGGGTLLIPILTVFFTVFQHQAQGINLISFVPMAIVAVILHAKNKLIEWKNALWLIIPAAAFSVLSALLSVKISQRNLQTYFGIFLVALGILQTLLELFNKKDQE